MGYEINHTEKHKEIQAAETEAIRDKELILQVDEVSLWDKLSGMLDITTWIDSEESILDQQHLPNDEFQIGDKTYHTDDNGNVYRINDDLLPNCNYEINGYKYTTDDLGRIVSASGELHLKDRDGRLPIKDSIEDIGKGDQKEGDDRGHLIGDQFDGSNGLENMIPQDANINRIDYKNFENELAQELREGKEVSVSIEPIYDESSHRPTDIVVTYSINGNENIRVFPNN